MAICFSNWYASVVGVHELIIYYPNSGLIMVIVGQVLRSTAMIHASTNFSHSVAFRKRDSHRLVTDGVYA